MNYGQRQAKLSVAMAAPFRRLSMQKGDKGGTNSAAHMEVEGIQGDGQDAFWVVVGGKSGTLV